MTYDRFNNRMPHWLSEQFFRPAEIDHYARISRELLVTPTPQMLEFCDGALCHLNLLSWWIAAQLFIPGSKLGVWQRLFEKVKGKDHSLGMLFLDSTTIRAHHKAAGATKKADTEDTSGIVRRLTAHVDTLTPRPA